MTLNTHKFALAATLTMAITYVVCAVFVALFPGLAVQFLGWMLHLVNVEKFVGGTNVTVTNVILGLLPIVFYTYVGSWIFVAFYNKFVRTS